MAPVQMEILSILNGRELSMNDLVNEVRGKSEVTSATTIKAAILPLISGDLVQMTADRKLRAHKK